MNLKSVDVSTFLHTIKQLQLEVKLLSTASVAQADLTDEIYQITKSLDERVTKIKTPNQDINAVPEGNTSAVNSW